MSAAGLQPLSNGMIRPEGLDILIRMLATQGRLVLGPVERAGAIIYEHVTGIGDLPAGRTDRQTPGSYRLEDRSDGALFGYVVGPDSWKRVLHRPLETIFRARRQGDDMVFETPTESAPAMALIGVRACELAAIAIQDRVLTDGLYVNTAYAARRASLFVVAVNCAEPAATCFCSSMGSGPDVTRGYDLALTELTEPAHEFLAEAGSEAGAAMLAAIPTRPATDGDLAAAFDVAPRAVARMSRSMPAEQVRQALPAHPEHPHWDDVAARCLACTNCTQVCPTCFCTTVEDRSSLDGEVAERVRRWDSCFTRDFTHMHGGAVRQQTRSRYRQWLSHKLAYWHDQFGTSGCVGCGRCIAWCPAGIDITVEAAAFLEARHADD